MIVLRSGVIVVLCGGLSGCGGSSNTGVPVVPGGAAVKAGAGAPGFCSDLVSDSSVRGLNAALTGLAQGPPEEGATERVVGAALSFRRIGAKAGSKLSGAFASAAVALESLAQRGVTNLGAIKRVDDTLARLGRKLQGTCDFPVG